VSAAAHTPKLFVGAGADLHVDFVPTEMSGEAAYWVVDTRKRKTADPLRVAETASGDGWVFDTKNQPVSLPPAPSPPPQRPYIMMVGAGGQVLGSVPAVSSFELAMSALGGFAVARWLGASWAAAGLAGLALPTGLVGLAYVMRRLSASAASAQ